MNNIPETVLNKSTKEFETNANAWDVSAQQDKSIVAWYNSNEVSNGTYKVYIGSDSEIFNVVILIYRLFKQLYIN